MFLQLEMVTYIRGPCTTRYERQRERERIARHSAHYTWIPHKFRHRRRKNIYHLVGLPLSLRAPRMSVHRGQLVESLTKPYLDVTGKPVALPLIFATRLPNKLYYVIMLHLEQTLHPWLWR